MAYTELNGQPEMWLTQAQYDVLDKSTVPVGTKIFIVDSKVEESDLSAALQEKIENAGRDYIPLSKMSAEVVADSVAQRQSNGALKVGAPVDDSDAVNLSYLNTQLTPVKTDVTNIKNVIPTEATSDNKLATHDDITGLDVRVINIELKIPAQASSSNQLADKAFVNSSIANEAADYISNNGQPFNSVEELEAYSGTVTNNDYAIVVTQDGSGNTVYNRYKYNADTKKWAFEYAINNSSFTAEQWAAINSGATAAFVSTTNTDISTLKTSVAAKADKTYVDGNFVKQVEANSQHVYGADLSGERTYLVDFMVGTNQIPMTDGNGCLKSANPIVDSDVTTKSYVDDKFKIIVGEGLV